MNFELIFVPGKAYFEYVAGSYEQEIQRSMAQKASK
jgi:hypothetical protein